MVSRMEINAITVAAEERKYQEHIEQEERIKENTRAYCSSSLSEELKKEANKPSRSFRVYTTIPDNDGDVHMYMENGYYYKPTDEYRNFDTMVQFIRDHGFDVITSEDTVPKNSTRCYSCMCITIKW
jgi:hypothetical protein